jgi:hypothetical protein
VLSYHDVLYSYRMIHWHGMACSFLHRWYLLQWMTLPPLSQLHCFLGQSLVLDDRFSGWFLPLEGVLRAQLNCDAGVRRGNCCVNFCFPLITNLTIDFVSDSHWLRTSRSIFVSYWLRTYRSISFPIDYEPHRDDQFCFPLIANLTINFVFHSLQPSRSILFPIDSEPQSWFIRIFKWKPRNAVTVANIFEIPSWWT